MFYDFFDDDSCIGTIIKPFLPTFTLCILLYAGCKWLKYDDEKFDGLFEQCKIACSNDDYGEANSLLTQMERYDNGEKMRDAKSFVLDKELLYLLSINSDEASKRVVYLLSEVQIPPEPYSEGIHQKEDGELPEAVKEYIDRVSDFNQKCDKAFNIAAMQDNRQLCKSIIKLYKKEAACEEVFDTTIVKTQSTRPVTRYKEKKLIGRIADKLTGGDGLEAIDDEETIVEEKEVVESSSFIIKYQNSAKERAKERYEELFGTDSEVDSPETLK